EVLLRQFHALGDGSGHFLRLAVAHADRAVTVAHDDQGGETETPATLDHLGYPVDVDDALDVVLLITPAAAIATAAVAPATAFGTALVTALAGATGPTALRCSHHRFLCLSVIRKVTGTDPLRAHPRPALRPGRGTGCRPYQTLRRRSRVPWLVRRSVRRPYGPFPSSLPPAPAGRPPAWRPRRA